MTDMAEDRKYKQRGYQESDERPKPGSPPPGPGGKKPPVFTAYRETVRCDSCGGPLDTHFEIGLDSRCPKCRADLHTCRNCFNLDPAARFECSRPVTARVENKQDANLCPLFESRRVQVKETTFSTAPRPDDARKALENLFRKK
jgi:hypothetical protein